MIARHHPSAVGERMHAKSVTACSRVWENTEGKAGRVRTAATQGEIRGRRSLGHLLEAKWRRSAKDQQANAHRYPVTPSCGHNRMQIIADCRAILAHKLALRRLRCLHAPRAPQRQREANAGLHTQRVLQLALTRSKLHPHIVHGPMGEKGRSAPGAKHWQC